MNAKIFQRMDSDLSTGFPEAVGALETSMLKRQDSYVWFATHLSTVEQMVH